MNSRNRVLTTLSQKEPDRILRLSTFTPEFAEFQLKEGIVTMARLGEIEPFCNFAGIEIVSV